MTLMIKKKIIKEEPGLSHQKELQSKNSGSHLLNTYKRHKINFISGHNHRAFYYTNCVAAHSMLFYRELLAYLDTLPGSIYYDQWLTCIACRLGTIHAADKKLVLYRRHDKQCHHYH